jgi:hypothetical protein
MKNKEEKIMAKKLFTLDEIKEIIMAQQDQNDLCETEVVWIDREDLLEDLEKRAKEKEQ